VKPFYLSSETVPPIKPFYLSNATCARYSLAAPEREPGAEEDGRRAVSQMVAAATAVGKYL
jgi:hypothetical protein